MFADGETVIGVRNYSVKRGKEFDPIKEKSYKRSISAGILMQVGNSIGSAVTAEPKVRWLLTPNEAKEAKLFRTRAKDSGPKWNDLPIVMQVAEGVSKQRATMRGEQAHGVA